MSPELETKLIKKYPQIFIDYENDNSPIHWGIRCGDGWYELLDTLCWAIQAYYDSDTQASDTRQHPKAVVAKEKFGQLRFAMVNADAYINGMIHFAWMMSAKICDRCGATGRIIYTDGWVRTRCANHQSLN